MLQDIAAKVAARVKDNVAKGVFAGMVQRAAQDWTLELMTRGAAEGLGFAELLAGRPDAAARLAQVFRNHKGIREATFPEWMSWLKNGNLVLYEQIVADTKIMDWMRYLWSVECVKAQDS